MKTVGKQLEEARLAKSWTPEMASRETKIKVDRVKDLESDDYSHFNNATYARGFVRTYARALGLDEYKILRQLDNKLPDDDTANIVSNEGGVAYLPETAMPPRVAHRDFTGLYVVAGLGGVVLVVIAFVLFRAYQVGELGKWTGEDTASNTTNNAPAVATDELTPKKALPIDSNTPPPTPAPEPAPTNDVAVTPAPAPDDTANAPRAKPVDLNAPDAPPAAPPKALPVDPSTLGAGNVNTPSPAPTPAPAVTDVPANAPKALPVSPADLAAANNPPQPTPKKDASVPVKAPPRALPVDLNAQNTPAVTDIPANAPKALPVSPADLAATGGDTAPATASNGPVVMPPANTPTTTPPNGNKPLVLTASRDSYVRVTMLDNGKQVFADVLHSGQSIAFNGHKFPVNVDDPSAVDIKLDGVNYGPHDDGTNPETFTVVSHVQ